MDATIKKALGIIKTTCKNSGGCEFCPIRCNVYDGCEEPDDASAPKYSCILSMEIPSDWDFV